MRKLLSKEEAAHKNAAVTMDERVRRAVHELTHHLIAEYYGLICDGIELGYMTGHPSAATGIAHYGDNLKRKNEASQQITPEENRAYIHAMLSNGYGDEAVFGTPPELRGDENDLYTARYYLESMFGYGPDEVEAFISKSITETRRILANSETKDALRKAGIEAAKDYWGTGQLMSRAVINDLLKIGKCR